MRSPLMMLQIRRLRDAQVVLRAFETFARKSIGPKRAQPLPVRQLDGANHARWQPIENAGNVDRAFAGIQALLAHGPPRLFDRLWHIPAVVAHMGEMRPRCGNALELFERDPAAMEV